MIRNQPLRHALAFCGNRGLSPFLYACGTTAVDVRLDRGRVHYIFECKFGTADGDIHCSKVEEITQNAKAPVFGAQNIFKLRRAAYRCSSQPLDKPATQIREPERSELRAKTHQP